MREEKQKRRADTWVGFHTFRHTCATVLFRRGWNAVQVQRWLGHHKPSFTLDTYVHLLEEDVPEPTFFDELTSAGYHFGYPAPPNRADTLAAASAQTRANQRHSAS